MKNRASKRRTKGQHVGLKALSTATLVALACGAATMPAPPAQSSAPSVRAETVENFETAEVESQPIEECDGPLEAGVESACFPGGDLQPGAVVAR